MIDKSVVTKFDELEEIIFNEAEKLMVQIHTISTIDGFDFLSISHIEDGHVEFRGEESWKYGGYEGYTFSIRMHLLYNEEAKEQYLQQLRDEEAKKLAKNIEACKKRKELQEQKDLKKYNELKQQFGETK